MKTEQDQIREYLSWKQSNTVWKLHRWDIINHFIEKFNYVNYLEIGVRNGDAFRRVIAEHKDGVDPGIEGANPPDVNYPITSDDFFSLIKDHDIKYDIIFIDGLHHDYQVYNDIKNSLNHLTPNGTIICHDMNPRWEIVQRKRFYPGVGTWNGDCWKAWVKLRTELVSYSMEVIDTDHGVGIIRKGVNNKLPITVDNFDELTFDMLDDNRSELLNLISVDQFLDCYK